MKRLLIAFAGLVACGGPQRGSAPAAGRALPASVEQAAKRFGEAVLAKDYGAAYGMMSSSYREAQPYPDFLQSIARYRDHVDGELKLGVRASDDDPRTLKDDAMVQMLVPEPLRGLIVEEAILDFEVDSGEKDGWVVVAWFVEESGQLRVLNYYQDD